MRLLPILCIIAFMKSRSSKNQLQIPPRGTPQYLQYLEAIEKTYLDEDEIREYEEFYQEEKDNQAREKAGHGLRNTNSRTNFFSSLFT